MTNRPISRLQRSPDTLISCQYKGLLIAPLAMALPPMTIPLPYWTIFISVYAKAIIGWDALYSH